MIDRASMVDWIGGFLLCWSEDGILPPDDVAQKRLSLSWNLAYQEARKIRHILH